MIILDTETTGLGSDAEICEIAMIDGDGKVLMNTLVKPTHLIPDEPMDIHGITNEMVANSPSWPELHDEFQKIVKGETVYIYNAEYDLRLLLQTASTHGLELADFSAACIMLEYALYAGVWDDTYDHWKWHKLTVAARNCGIPNTEAHRALADCKMTLGVFNYMKANPQKPTANSENQEGIDDAIAGAKAAGRGYTPLHAAVMINNIEAGKFFILDGADVNAETNDGFTPLHWAAKNDHVEFAQLLLSSGAEIEVEDIDGNAPLHIAAKNNSVRVAEFLLDNDSNVNAINDDSCTPLHLAASENTLNVAKVLIESGADINAIDSDGESPVDHAEHFTNPRMVRLLSESADADTTKVDKELEKNLWGCFGVSFVVGLIILLMIFS